MQGRRRHAHLGGWCSIVTVERMPREQHARVDNQRRGDEHRCNRTRAPRPRPESQDELAQHDDEEHEAEFEADRAGKAPLADHERQ